jgi:hypothetical protein
MTISARSSLIIRVSRDLDKQSRKGRVSNFRLRRNRDLRIGTKMAGGPLWLTRAQSRAAKRAERRRSALGDWHSGADLRVRTVERQLSPTSDRPFALTILRE